MEIRVGVEGNRFTLNGEKRVLFMRDGFAVMSHLDKWAMGWGGQWENYVDLFFDRVTSQGFDGVRVFGETSGWKRGTGKFFPHYATSDKMWPYNQLRNGHRPTNLTVHNQKLILKLIEKLHKHGLICEYITDATLKHDGVDAGTISHCIRQTASFFRHVEAGEMDPEVIFHSVQDMFPDLMGKDINIFHELHNEWDAHNQAGLTLSELNQQFVRHRRYKDGQPEQWPRGIVGVSHGGKNSVDYLVGRPEGADYVALHPERSGAWETRTNLEKRYSNYPRYYNEPKNYCSPAEYRRWVIDGPFSPTSSTKDLDKYLDFMYSTLENGISFCVHDVVGMQAGLTTAGQIPPITPLEEHLDAPAPPPPPPPTDKVDYRREIDAAYQMVLGRNADESGYTAYNDLLNEDRLDWADLVDQLMHSEERRKTQPEPPPPNPTPPPMPEKDYLRIERAPELQRWIDDNLNIWAGVRDPQYVLSHCSWSCTTVFGITCEEMRDFTYKYDSLINLGAGMRKALAEPHATYPNRSRVKKATWEEYKTEVEVHNEVAEAWRQAVTVYPGAGTHYDSIKGWCEYMNKYGLP
jgi:hypothetical protein